MTDPTARYADNSHSDMRPTAPLAEYVLQLPVYNNSATGTGPANATAAQSHSCTRSAKRNNISAPLYSQILKRRNVANAIHMRRLFYMQERR